MVMNLSKYKCNSRSYHNTCIRHMKVHLHIPQFFFSCFNIMSNDINFFAFLFCFFVLPFHVLLIWQAINQNSRTFPWLYVKFKINWPTSKFPDFSLTLRKYNFPWLFPDLCEPWPKPRSQSEVWYGMINAKLASFMRLGRTSQWCKCSNHHNTFVMSMAYLCTKTSFFATDHSSWHLIPSITALPSTFPFLPSCYSYSGQLKCQVPSGQIPAFLPLIGGSEASSQQYEKLKQHKQPLWGIYCQYSSANCCRTLYASLLLSQILMYT